MKKLALYSFLLACMYAPYSISMDEYSALRQNTGYYSPEPHFIPLPKPEPEQKEETSLHIHSRECYCNITRSCNPCLECLRGIWERIKYCCSNRINN